MKEWYVLHLRPRCEKKLGEYSRIYGVSYYLPLRRETKVYQRRKVTVEKPLFPGYFFCAFDNIGRRNLMKSDHILQVITPHSRRHLLHELAQIRRALRVDPTLSACSALATGRRVRILGGPFMGVEGLVQSLRGKNKVCLNVDMIGRAVAVEVDREYLEVID
jgi:transcription antitermination factor NusG